MSRCHTSLEAVPALLTDVAPDLKDTRLISQDTKVVLTESIHQEEQSGSKLTEMLEEVVNCSHEDKTHISQLEALVISLTV